LQDVPFGVMNVLFTRDFGQLKPVGEFFLYSNELVGCVDTRMAANACSQQELINTAIWWQVWCLLRALAFDSKAMKMMWSQFFQFHAPSLTSLAMATPSPFPASNPHSFQLTLIQTTKFKARPSKGPSWI